MNLIKKAMSYNTNKLYQTEKRILRIKCKVEKDYIQIFINKNIKHMHMNSGTSSRD